MHECIAVSISQEILQKQDFIAKARFSCKSKIFLQKQDFLAKARFFLQKQDFLAKARFSCKCKIFLQMQDFSCKCKIFLQMQDFLANARFSCKCKIFLPVNVKVLFICSGSPSYLAVQYITFEILSRDTVDFLYHQISFFIPGHVQKWYCHLQKSSFQMCSALPLRHSDKLYLILYSDIYRPTKKGPAVFFQLESQNLKMP